MLLAAAFPSEWTSGEDLACDEEEMQAGEGGGTSWRGAAFLEDDPAVGSGLATTAGETASRAAFGGAGLGKPVKRNLPSRLRFTGGPTRGAGEA